MSDQVFGDDFDDSDDMSYQKTTSTISGKKIAILVALLILLVLGAGAAVFFSGVLDELTTATEEPAPAAAQGQATTSQTPVNVEDSGQVAFLDLPEIVVNLNAQGVRKSYLKLKLAIELLSPEQENYMKDRVPRIMDSVQVYLRELTPDGLRGSAGLTKMRANLEARINAAVAPQAIGGVLFQEVLVQ
ncbi:MAG: flagellar basal body-associated FliL family protein [Pseudomonadota bacterium]